MKSIYTTLEDGVRSLALAANADHPNVPIIFSHQGGGEPSESYIVINLLSVNQEGHSSTPAMLNRDRKMDVRVMYVALVQFSFYGSKSPSVAHDFLHHLNSPGVVGLMSKYNISIMSKTRLRRNPQKRDSKWVEAFTLDITFNYIVNTPVNVDWVEDFVHQLQCK